MKKNSKRNFNIPLFFIGYFIILLTNHYLVTTLEMEQYGDFKVFESFINLLIPISILGGESGAYLFLPKYMINKQYKKTLAYIIFFTAIAAIAALLIFLCEFFITKVASSLSQNGIELHASIGFLFVSAFIAFSYMLVCAINSSKQYTLATIARRILLPLPFFCVVYFLSHARHTPTIQHILNYYILTYLASTIVLCITLFQLLPKKAKPQEHDFDIKNWLSSSFPILLNNLLTLLITQASIIILESMGEGEIIVGIFGAMSALCHIFWIIYGAQTFRYERSIALHVQSGNTERLQQQTRKIILSIYLYSLPVLLGVLFNLQHVLMWMQINPAHHSLEFTALFTGIWLCAAPSFKNYLLIISSHRKIVVTINLIALLMLCISTVILVPTYHLWGAILPIIVSRAFTIIAYNHYCRKHLNLAWFF